MQHQAYTPEEIAHARQVILEGERLLAYEDARDDLIRFTEITMPHVKFPDDPTMSRYDAQKHHRALAAVLEEVERGGYKRVIITFPPRHGKSELATRRFPAWCIGRDPYRHLMIGSYNSTFAEDFGRDVRAIMEHPAFAQVFPDCKLQSGSKSAERLRTETRTGEGGQIVFLGRGGSATGRGADILIVDDPIKSRKEAQSETIRNDVWDWFNDDIMTRMMTDEGVVIIIVTRWHEDDLVGRLTDPDNPHYNPEEAANWQLFNVPAIAEENDPLGRKPGEALWPNRFGVDYLKSIEARNPRGFASLYQQHPTPQDGDLFTNEMWQPYSPDELPPLSELRKFAASDHALTKKEENDANVFGIVGVDKTGMAWILDVWWKRAKSDEQVEQMIKMARTWRPVIWWAETDHITKAIGPFLKRRMLETGVFINIQELPNQADKVSKGQSFVSRAAQGMFRFPKFAPWAERGKSELLKVPNGTHDDFWDMCSNLGRGIHIMHGGGIPQQQEERPAVGTLAWVKQDAKFRARHSAMRKARRGM